MLGERTFTKRKHGGTILHTMNLLNSYIQDDDHQLANAIGRNKCLTCLNGMALSDELMEVDLSHRTGGLAPYESSFIGARLAHGADELDILNVSHNQICALHLDGSGDYNPYGGAPPPSPPPSSRPPSTTTVVATVLPTTVVTTAIQNQVQ